MRNAAYCYRRNGVVSLCVYNVGRRTFPVAASLLCNSLPSDIQSSRSLPVFRQRRKTFLSRQSINQSIKTLIYVDRLQRDKVHMVKIKIKSTVIHNNNNLNLNM